MSENLSLSAEKYYHKAEEVLKKKDLFDFAANISNAELLSANDEKLLAKVTFLKVKGLFKLRQYRKMLENFSDTLKLNEPDQYELRIFQGISLAFIGEYKKAKNTFTSILSEKPDQKFIVDAYLNLAWLYTILYKKEPNEENLQEMKEYIDLANAYFNGVETDKKRRICINFSVYYYYAAEYEKAIDILTQSLQYSDEAHLPEIYNNLAEIYMKLDEHGVAEEVHKYSSMAETVAAKYKNNLELAKAFYTKAMAEMRKDQLFTALDSLYLAFEYFKAAEAFPYAFDCLVKINEIVNEYKVERLKALKDSVVDDFQNTAFVGKLS